MASKIVTLKDHNNDIAYPITPVDAVFVDTNTTLSDELNDKADADMSNIDNASITSSKIDWTTLPNIRAGKTESKTIGANGATTFTVAISPAFSSTNYFAVATLTIGGAYWGSNNFLKWKATVTNSSSFQIEVWNDNSQTVTGVSFNWIAIWLPS